MTTNQAAAWVAARLKTIPALSGRVFPDMAPKGTPNPCAVYQMIEANADERMDSGAPADGMAAFQVRVYGASRKQAGEIMEAARQRLANAESGDAGGWRLDGTAWGRGADTHDKDTDDYGATAVVEVHGE